MKITLSSIALAVALSATVVGCAQKRTPPAAKGSSSPTSAKSVTLPPLADEGNQAGGGGAGESDTKEKRPRFGESFVYVDGKAVGVLKSTELPAGLKGRQVNIGDGYMVTRYGILDYVRALGVDAKKIKALHLYGGSRVVAVDKAETARIGDGIMFSFVQGTRGKPRIHWPAVKLNVNSTIDMVSNVAVYVEKEPPTLDANGELVMPDGSKVTTKVPYAPEEQGSGTRIYVDGNLVGAVKRKRITNDMLLVSPGADTTAAKTAPSEKSNGEDRFSLLSYATMLRADAKQAKSIDLVAGDDVIAHLTSDQVRNIAFNVPQRNRGQAVVDVLNEGASQRARISAVQIYVNVAPPSRTVVKIDNAPEAAIRTGQGGSGSDEEL